MAQHETYLHCPGGTSLSLLLPSGTVLSKTELRHQLQTAVAKQVSSSAGDGNTANEETAEQRAADVLNEVDGSASSQARARWILDTPTALADAGSWKPARPRRNRRLEAASDVGAGQDEAAARSAQVSALLSGTRNDVCFSVAFEFRLPTLPRKGQRAALIRFAPPPVVPGRQAKRQEASVFVDERGDLLGSSGMNVQQLAAMGKSKDKGKGKHAAEPGVEPVTKPATEPTAEPEPEPKSLTAENLANTPPQQVIASSVVAGRWQVLVATVDCQSSSLSLFVDGELVCECTAAAPADATAVHGLGLGARIVLLGGGKQSESRGGACASTAFAPPHFRV